MLIREKNIIFIGLTNVFSIKFYLSNIYLPLYNFSKIKNTKQVTTYTKIRTKFQNKITYLVIHKYIYYE